MTKLTCLLLASAALAGCATVPASVPPASAPRAAESATGLSALAGQVAIPYQRFTLDNGLTVLVHTDRKAPVVAVNVTYKIGSKDEPAGKTGFAHLFEHLMFNGSENAPGDTYAYLQKMGGTDYNGTTNFDRTNYYETVPTGALERALFLESDRMGHLLGAVSQKVLDNQRGVVQNEKRQRDNAPGGMAGYQLVSALFPPPHPYSHMPIGSMADLDAASLADVAGWFQRHYAPNNATLVLAGDIDAAQARPLVEKYFGALAAGPENQPAAAAVPVPVAPRDILIKDRVATTSISRYWPVPGLADAEFEALDVGAAVLGGLASSRLDAAMVRTEKLAVSVSAGLSPFQRVGFLAVSAEVKPGVDPALVAARLDALVADYLATGPTQDEIDRAVTGELAGRIKGLEQVGGKAAALAEGEVLTGSADWFKATLGRYTALTPQRVGETMRRWMTKPPLRMMIVPGEREPYVETKVAKAAGGDSAATAAPRGAARAMPPVTPVAGLDFPDVSRATLSNGIPVVYAQRAIVPVTRLTLSFDAGDAADPIGQAGVNSFMVSMLDEGAAGRTSQQIAEAAERLGADLSTGASLDRDSVSLSALSARLGPSLDLLADLVQRPDFVPAEIDRLRAQRLAAIAQMQKDPNGIASRLMPELLYGKGHAYGGVVGGDAAVIAKLDQATLLAFKDRWLRPDRLKIFVVSDRPQAEVVAALEQRFGSWRAPAVAPGEKALGAAATPPTRPRIVLVDRPGSPQSVIVGGMVSPVDPRGDVEAVGLANDVLAGTFLSRINMDLREDKGWSYGVSGGLKLNEHGTSYVVSAPVQANRTGEAIAALVGQFRAFAGGKGLTADELSRAVANRADALPSRYETAASVLGALVSNDLFGRPDDYQETLAARYRGYAAPALDTALRGAVDIDRMTWIVVGDAATVRPQLDKLGYAIEVTTAR